MAAAEDTAAFVSAKPVWLEGREKEKNVFAGFRATVDGKAAEKRRGAVDRRDHLPGLRERRSIWATDPRAGLTASTAWTSGRSRATASRGPNVVAIEVAGYNANSYYFIDQPSFLQTEVVAGKKGARLHRGRGCRV